MPDDNIVRFKNFSTSPEPVTFEIEPDTFVCLPDIALDVLTELASVKDSTDKTAQMDRIHDFFDYLMEPDSAAVFRRRTAVPTKDNPNPRPIGMRTVLDVMNWLMEVYGLRPTQPSNESADGSSSDAESLTDGVLLEESTS